ncbi:N-acetylmuramoyl-L-alanine amidase, partial [Polaribacter sp.]|nr:N-acetylmuramoyl-L-alanine amidase [Polaribacter sp.]
SYIKNLKLNTVIDSVNTVATINEIKFKVQIGVGKNRLITKSYNFKGLKNIERKLFGSVYKYYYGNSSSYNAIKDSLEKAKSKGYKQAFIIAFKNGKKIALEEALKMPKY